MSLTDTVLEGLLESIMGEQFAAGTTLPPEAEIAIAHGVSRVTVREALKTLQAGNVVTIRRGIGTFVNAPDQWTSLETVLIYASRNSSAATAAADLIEVHGGDRCRCARRPPPHRDRPRQPRRLHR
jgi:GntR family transcriptional repressor for pyruvate dehydrogenase complex